MSTPTATATAAAALREVLTTDPLAATVDALTVELRELETLKCALEARQARAAVALDDVMRRRAAESGAPAARQGRGVAEMLAYARRVSPPRGRVLLGLAKAVEEMPRLKAAFAIGKVSEWRTMLVARETACLELADRQRIDTELAADADALERMGDRQLAGAARRRAVELDDASVVRRRARAEADRRVTIRPAPDTMVYLTALLPVVEGVAAYAALKTAAETAVATGAASSRSRAMADALIRRVTGREPGAMPLTVNLLINEEALLGASEETAHLEAVGVVEDLPAGLARDLITNAIDEQEKVALRRLFTHPASGQLVAMESTTRLFPSALGRFIRLRDRVCRTPWCDAPIRHLDHHQPWAQGGRTTAENGQGLCEQCNHARQSATGNQHRATTAHQTPSPTTVDPGARDSPQQHQARAGRLTGVCCSPIGDACTMLVATRPMAADVRVAYLKRLGLEAEPPSAQALRRLMNRHAERVPYETLWIAAGEAWDIEPHRAAARIALEHRGGYCYHLNGAFGLLLQSLGYVVHAHAGGVHGPDGPAPEALGNHLVLTLSGLPSDTCPDGVWYVDTGLGDALHDPWPLVAGPIDQPPFLLSLERAAGESWHLTHDPAGGFRGMTWTPGPAETALLEAKHQWLSTSPDSGFVQVPMAQRRDATGVDVMRGLVLMRIGEGARTDAPLTRRAAWFDALADVFGLTFETMTAQTRDRLWDNLRAAHERWERSTISVR